MENIMRRNEFDDTFDQIESEIKKKNIPGAQIMALMLIAGLLYDINVSILSGELSD
jgi:hypothetical protein